MSLDKDYDFVNNTLLKSHKKSYKYNDMLLLDENDVRNSSHWNFSFDTAELLINKLQGGDLEKAHLQYLWKHTGPEGWFERWLCKPDFNSIIKEYKILLNKKEKPNNILYSEILEVMLSPKQNIEKTQEKEEIQLYEKVKISYQL